MGERRRLRSTGVRSSSIWLLCGLLGGRAYSRFQHQFTNWDGRLRMGVCSKLGGDVWHQRAVCKDSHDDISYSQPNRFGDTFAHASDHNQLYVHQECTWHLPRCKTAPGPWRNCSYVVVRAGGLQRLGVCILLCSRSGRRFLRLGFISAANGGCAKLPGVVSAELWSLPFSCRSKQKPALGLHLPRGPGVRNLEKPRWHLFGRERSDEWRNGVDVALSTKQ